MKYKGCNKVFREKKNVKMVTIKCGSMLLIDKTGPLLPFSLLNVFNNFEQMYTDLWVTKFSLQNVIIEKPPILSPWYKWYKMLNIFIDVMSLNCTASKMYFASPGSCSSQYCIRVLVLHRCHFLLHNFEKTFMNHPSTIKSELGLYSIVCCQLSS